MNDNEVDRAFRVICPSCGDENEVSLFTCTACHADLQSAKEGAAPFGTLTQCYERGRANEDDELRAAMRTILRGFHEGVFVRSTIIDYQSDWAIRLVPFMRALRQAQEMIGGDQCLGEDCPIHGGPNSEGRR